MSASTAQRFLSIGEFAAATQLSPKALRIYDEQRLLTPARIDAATGYRLYRSDQVPAGRLIRTLREMGLSLPDIASVVSSRGSGAEAVLAQLAHELEHRYAREKRAYQKALLLLHDAPRASSPEITEQARAAMTVLVRPFMASRYDFVEKRRAEEQIAGELAAQAGLTLLAKGACSLLDPLSDDEGRLELVIPVAMPAKLPNGLTLRQLPAASCAVITSTARHSHASEFAGALDALFDWFDRHACRAIEPALVTIETDAELRTTIAWAFERARA